MRQVSMALRIDRMKVTFEKKSVVSLICLLIPLQDTCDESESPPLLIDSRHEAYNGDNLDEEAKSMDVSCN